MAKKISDLTPATALGDNDSFVFNDVVAGNDKRVTVSSLRADADVVKVDTVADLRNLEGKRDGQVVELLGYSTAGDGGQGPVYWDLNSTEADDGGTVFKVSGVTTGRWKRQIGKTIFSAWFGIKNDNVNRASEFSNLVNVATTKKTGINTGEGTLKLDISSTIDLSGIPFWEGETEIDLSGGTSVRFFEVVGSKNQISANAISINSGANTIPVNTSVSPGDELIIVSDELLPNNPRGNYYKGERNVVSSYSDNQVTLQTPVLFNYTTSAYVFKLSTKSIVLSNNLIFRGKRDNDVCFRFRYADAKVESEFVNFGYSSVQFNSSRGSFRGNTKGAWYSGTPTSYGVSINDLSIVNISDSKIFGGRHAISAGGGIESLTDIGGSGSAVYPSIITVTNSILTTSTEQSVGALDAHGNVYSMAATNNLIIGGIQSSANYSTISGNIVFFQKAAGFITPSEGDSINWGHCILTDNHFIGIDGGLEGSGISITGISKSLKASGNYVYGDWGGVQLSTATPVRISGEVSDISICDNRIERIDLVSTSERSTINVSKRAEFSGNHSTGNRYELISIAADADLLIEGNDIYNVPNSYGIFVNGSSHYFSNTRLNQNAVKGCPLGGIYVFKSTRVSAFQNELINNGTDTSASVSTRVGLRLNDVAEVDLDSNLLYDNQSVPTQQYGVYTFAHATLPTNVRWSNNNLIGVEKGAMFVLAGNILRQNGNRGTFTIPDYILATDGSLYKFDGTNHVPV